MEHLESSIVLLQDFPKKATQADLHFAEVPTMDFLLKKKIIPKTDAWDPVDEIQDADMLSMPLMLTKTILFNNKIRITSEPTRLIILQNMTDGGSLDDLKQIGSKLVEKIKDVKYVSAGINFLSIFKCDDPELEIKKRFLKEIKRLPVDKIIGGNLSYRYQEGEDILATMDIFPARKKGDPSDKFTHISFSVNYNFGLSYQKKIEEFIQKISSLREHYLNEVSALLGQENGQ